MKLFIAFISMFVFNQAQASFLESCQFDMKITKVEAQSLRMASQQPYTRKVTAVVTKTKDDGGHITCDHHMGKEYTMDLGSVSLENLAILAANYPIQVDYFHVNSLTPDGVVSNTSYTLVSQAQRAYQAAKNNADVQARIQELQTKLNSPSQEYVVELQANVVGLDEGICGFAGCDSVHLITLTYGEDFQNSARETLIVKVYMSALGESVNVEIL